MTNEMTAKEAVKILKDERDHDIFVATEYREKIHEALTRAIHALEQEDVLEKIRAEIKAKIEEEEFARSVFRHEEKDTYKAEQCTGSIMAYNNVIKLIDKYREGGAK